MKMKLTFALLLFFTWSIRAQTISTLISDATRSFESIHWHESGRILSVDYNNGRIYEIEVDGSVMTLHSGLSNPAGGGFDEDGKFYFSELGTGRLFLLNDDNTKTLIASSLSQPTGVYPIPDSEELLVCQYQGSTVIKVDENTGEKASWAFGGGISGPDGIIPFEDGFLVANFNNTKIHRIDSNGEVSPFVDLGAAGFLGYIAEVNGNIYTPTFNGKKIYRVDPDGNYQIVAGSGSTGSDDGNALNASFTQPNGICSNVSGDTILITDGSRVRVFTGFEPTSTSIKESDYEFISLSPNPATNVLTVNLESVLQPLSWQITDNYGQSIRTGDFKDVLSFKIDVSEFSKGQYIFTWVDKNKNTHSKTFVKQ